MKNQIIPDIHEGWIKSAYSNYAFDEAKAALESRGYRVISLEQQAGLRVQEGPEADISIRGNWVRECFVYIHSRGIFLAKKSPIMKNAREATNCHRNGSDFYLNEQQVEEALSDALEIKETEIPTSEFADRDLTAFAFGKNARGYGEFLRDNGIGSINVNLTASQEEPFARQIWLHWIDCVNGSSLDCLRNLHFRNYGVRGVCSNLTN